LTLVELHRLLDSALRNTKNPVLVTITDISGDDELDFILSGAVEAARRWGARLSEIHLPLSRFSAATAAFPHILFFDSGDIGVMRLQYQPAGDEFPRLLRQKFVL